MHVPASTCLEFGVLNMCLDLVSGFGVLSWRLDPASCLSMLPWCLGLTILDSSVCANCDYIWYSLIGILISYGSWGVEWLNGA